MYRFLLIAKVGMLAFFALISSAHILPVQAQTSDPRIFQLEEQVRQLTGQVEELNFQLLQLQENLRKQQEDLEFRLQDLENKQGALVPQDVPAAATAVAEASPSVAETPAIEEEASAAVVDAKVPRLSTRLADGSGAPPRNLGSMTLDANGNVIETAIDFSAQKVTQSIDGTKVASLGGAQNPEELYQAGYTYILNGDYVLAEGVFSSFAEIYPNDPLGADAHFWLGESILAQGRFEDAADVFIKARSLYPDARKAPETLLKIGTIMAALGNREVACVTFEDALKNQTQMSAALKNRIGQEHVNAKC